MVSDVTTRRVFLALLAITLLGAPQRPLIGAGPPLQRAESWTDFDWALGAWRTHVRRVKSPLSGETEWLEYEGTTVVHRLLDGRSNVAELRVQGPAGAIAGVSLRLYHPARREWSIHYASVADGQMSPPLIGGFKNGRGEFFGHDTFLGRKIRVRFVMTDITPRSARFEQAFSDDGGKTWEVNWIATDTRVEG